MPNLYSNNNDGRVLSSTTTWAGARDDTSGTATSISSSSSANFTAVNRFGSRGGGNSYRVERSFMYFDTSGITGTVSSATIKIYGAFASDGSCIAVKSTAFGGDGGTSLAGGDFDAISGWTTGASAEGNVTKYSSPAIGNGLATTWSTSGYNSLASTSDLRSDMQNNNVVIICFMDYTFDYLNSTPTVNNTYNVGAYYTNYTGTSRDPYIEYEIASVGFGHEVNNVASGSIAKVKGVATASIAKVIGVD